MSQIVVIILVLASVLAIRWSKEPRSMLNAGLFGLLLAFGYLLLMETAFRSDWGTPIYAYLTLGLFVGGR